jgi:hypothetical protein
VIVSGTTVISPTVKSQTVNTWLSVVQQSQVIQSKAEQSTRDCQWYDSHKSYSQKPTFNTWLSVVRQSLVLQSKAKQSTCDCQWYDSHKSYSQKPNIQHVIVSGTTVISPTVKSQTVNSWTVISTSQFVRSDHIFLIVLSHWKISKDVTHSDTWSYVIAIQSCPLWHMIICHSIQTCPLWHMILCHSYPVMLCLRQ